jgi:hypothetical protein
MTEIHDPALRDTPARVEPEDTAILHREVSAYLEFWRIAAGPPAGGRRSPGVAPPR